MKVNKTEHIDITPDKSIFHKIGEANYSISDAIAELVDNSIDAAGEDGVEVVVVLDKKNNLNTCNRLKSVLSINLYLTFAIGSDFSWFIDQKYSERILVRISDHTANPLYDHLDKSLRCCLSKLNNFFI